MAVRPGPAAFQRRGVRVRRISLAIVALAMLGALASGCGGGGKVIVQNGEQISVNRTKYLKALDLQRKQDWFNALKEWDEVIKDEPRFALAHHNKAVCYDMMNFVPEAMAEYELARRYDPNNSITLNNLGAIYLRADNRLNSAFDALQEALKLDPYRPSVHYNLAAAYLTSKDFDKALMHADTAVDLVAAPSKETENGLQKSVDLPMLARYLLRQAECHIERSEMDKARKALERVEKQCREKVPADLWARVGSAESTEEVPPRG
ncbi:MAG: hypothetical protein HPKKFMNG_02516 [Planctomycetes bacterium]|nr:hypothetical protein [Planctomycetota bacterium]MCQ3950502.1 hypothetical protein [Planctomycetota bacterium]